jgi:hypothetical protein
MAHRGKHRNMALVKRVAAGRQIKTDQTPEGQARWDEVRERLFKPQVQFYDEHAQLIP